MKHGHAKRGARSGTYNSWRNMLQRCQRDDLHNSYLYKEKGITVCARWLKFENFLADMGERPPGKTIDRIDGSLGYFPSNCKWATPYEQALNHCNYNREKLAQEAGF
jgi:hypothetical protein